VFSYTSQIFLPSLEGNMIDPSKFECMLNWWEMINFFPCHLNITHPNLIYRSHVAAAIFKALFGYVGFLTFQEDTRSENSNNIVIHVDLLIPSVRLLHVARF